MLAPLGFAMVISFILMLIMTTRLFVFPMLIFVPLDGTMGPACEGDRA